MIFYYIRHGHPIYNPDSLTPLGQRQAEAVGKRLAVYGVDKIYTSTSNRAIETARPTCELLHKESVALDFANEGYAYEDFAVPIENGKRCWFFVNKFYKDAITSEEIINLGFKWYDQPPFKANDRFKKGIDRIFNESDEFFKNLGYEHIRYSGKYKVTKSNNERVAFFAHQGFGLAFLSCILDIPFPMFSTHFDITHSGITVINFDEVDGYSIPKVLTLSSDSHLYKEGLPTKYNNALYI